jgi:hypothetical protein
MLKIRGKTLDNASYEDYTCLVAQRFSKARYVW